jgi:hypothetical protein
MRQEWVKEQSDAYTRYDYLVYYITLHCIIIQLTPHWGFSVTDYIKYHAVMYLA